MKILIIIVCVGIALYCGALTGFTSIIICALIGVVIGVIYTIVCAKREKTTQDTSTAGNQKAQETDITETQIVQIEKYKKLKDEGVITQEEFDAKKKQILGL